MHTTTEQVKNELLFAPEELELGAYPGCVRRVVITESSPELARIQEGRAQQRKQGIGESKQNRAQANSDAAAYRNLVASIINVSLSDIEVAMRSDDPRMVSITHRNKTRVLPNEAFDSAIEFIFGMEEAPITNKNKQITWIDYSPFNSYCVLMGWSASVFRKRLLRLYPQIDALIDSVLKDGGWLRAPVASYH